MATAERKLQRYHSSYDGYQNVLKYRSSVFGDEDNRTWKVHLAIGTALMGMKRYEEAIKEVRPWTQKHILRAGFDDVISHLFSRVLVYSAIANRDFQNAQEFGNDWFGAEPSTDESVNLSRLIAQGEIALGQNDLTKAKKFADQAEAYLNRPKATEIEKAATESLQGACIAKQGDSNQAAKYFDRAQKRFDTNAKSIDYFQVFLPELLQERLSQLNSE